MEDNKIKTYRKRTPGFTFGIILVLLGMVFLAFNFGLFQNEWKRVLFSWQMLLIVVGVITFLHRNFFNGLVLIAVGGFFILPRLAQAAPEAFYWVSYDFTRTYWPVLLIIAGILMLLHIIIRPHHHHKADYYSCSDTSYTGKKNPHRTNYNRGFDRSTVFGNVEEIILDPVFTDGEINAVFGGVTMDLRKTSLAEGETRLELNAVFGGITLFVPEDWHVELHLTSVFGGFNDNRILSDNIDHSRKLIVVGGCVFGGGEIRN
ncbi:hypothetical protein D0T49_00945 [Paludibacter sp. 221]|uniref:LiaI-LiaF-like domain-containing protein n=1 Tax=Paludibacter sp. 221 TaxID=2302939 RepID=UPI0013D2CAF9|nr:DUF5668 domain-containing protein [Paludibacter sp. 221]NDV45621.1 hypothetical protein [Paludibacter sp. 221]